MIQGSPIIPSLMYNQSVHFRKGAISLLREISEAKILVIAYPEASENEAYQKAISNLEGNSIFEEKCSAATETEVLRLREIYTSKKIDLIVAIGGGQVMDSSKALRLLLENHSIDFPSLLENERASRSINLIAIPTTPSTGSEGNGTAVIKNEKGVKIPHIHRLLIPEVAILDSSFLQTIEEKQLHVFIGDIFGHANESLLSKKASPMTKAISQSIIALLKEASLELSEKPGSAKALDILLQAGYLGGLMTGSVYVGVCHALAHALEQQNGTPHSAGVLTLTPKCLTWHENVTNDSIYSKLKSDFEELGLSTYIQPGVLDGVDIDSWIEEALADPSIKTSPVRMKEGNLRELVQWILKK
ncbi:MAG: iron-containing alcohol dehydrogenase [Candidatus Thorarchaeota archaeon]